MAHRIISQIVFTSVRILGRALTEAYKQAAANSRHSAAVKASAAGANNRRGGSGGPGDGPWTGSSPNSSIPSWAGLSSKHAGLTLDEACLVLNLPITAVRAGETTPEAIKERSKRLFELNNPKKGGSFYLQSKIFRAGERVLAESEAIRLAARREAELKAGWKPKIYNP